MSGEGSEQRSGPAEAIVARRSSRPEMPGWLLKEGADEEDESGSEYDPAEELPEPDEEAAEYEVDGVVRGRVRLKDAVKSTRPVQKHQQAPATPHMGNARNRTHADQARPVFRAAAHHRHNQHTPNTRRRAHRR